MKKIMLVGVLLLSSLVLAQNKKTVLDYWKVIGNDINVSDYAADLKNDYLSYSGGWEGGGEFAVWRRKNGTDLIGDSSYGCGPACFISRVKFVESKGKGFVDVTAKMLPGMVFPADDNPSLRLELEKKILAVYNRKTGEKASVEQMSYYLKFPRRGTTITIQSGEFSDSDVVLGYYKFNGTGFVFELAK